VYIQSSHRAAEIFDEIEVVESHLHGKARWFGKLPTQTASAWATALDQGTGNLYRAISGSDTYGADTDDEAQVFGTADEVTLDAAYFDPHEILVVANSSATLYLNRIVWGTGTLASAVAAGQYSEIPFIRAVADKVRKVIFVMSERLPAGTKVWLQTMNVSDNATIDFIVGLHPYDV